MSSESSFPLPLDPSPQPEADDRRLWIGNLDNRLTEYHLIKLLQKHGKVRKFDFLFHKSGPQKGQPRGYCFVTYEEKHQAQVALQELNGMFIMNKHLLAKWAHTIPTETVTPKESLKPGITSEEPKKNKNVYSQISAIEAKLKAMEAQQDKDLEVCLSAVPNSGDCIWQQTEKPVIRNNMHRNRDLAPYNRVQRRNNTSNRYIKQR